MITTDELEIRKAKVEAELSRIRLEAALSSLEQKVEASSAKVQSMIHKAQAPVRFTRRNPLASVAMCLVTGFAVGTLAFGAFSRGRTRVRRATSPHRPAARRPKPVSPVGDHLPQDLP